nr:MAG TPA: hypothetical protein [Bacteriophage sp.]
MFGFYSKYVGGSKGQSTLEQIIKFNLKINYFNKTINVIISKK